jgi:hypothetical protein
MKNVANSISVLAKNKNPLKMREMIETVYKTLGSIATKKIIRSEHMKLLKRGVGNRAIHKREIGKFTKQIKNDKKMIKNLERKMTMARKKIDFLLKKRIISMAKILSSTSKK